MFLGKSLPTANLSAFRLDRDEGYFASVVMGKSHCCNDWERLPRSRDQVNTMVDAVEGEAISPREWV